MWVDAAIAFGGALLVPIALLAVNVWIHREERLEREREQAQHTCPARPATR